MKADFSAFKVNYMTVLHTITIIQTTVPILLKPWIFVTWLYCWRPHLATQKDMAEH
jgi:hypothetical protein